MTPVWPVAVCTGHRPKSLATPDAIRWVAAELDRIAVKLAAEHGTETALTGMALGADQMWAASALDAGMRLWAHVPFPEQPDPWSPDQQTAYRRLLEFAGHTTVYGELGNLVDPARRRLALKLLGDRNTGMVHATVAAGGVCVAVLRSSKFDGGTRDAFDKALAAGVPVIHVDPDRRTVTLPRPQIQTTPTHEQETLPI